MNVETVEMKANEKQAYTPVLGDQVDELFSLAVKQSECTLTLERLKPGLYMFGTKKVNAVA